MASILPAVLNASLPIAAGYGRGQFLRSQEEERKQQEAAQLDRQRRQDEMQRIIHDLAVEERTLRNKALRNPPPEGVDFDFGALSGTAGSIDEAAQIFESNKDRISAMNAASRAPTSAGQYTPWQSHQVAEQDRELREESIVAEGISWARGDLPLDGPYAGRSPVTLTNWFQNRHKLDPQTAARLALRAWQEAQDLTWRERRNVDEPEAEAATGSTLETLTGIGGATPGAGAPRPRASALPPAPDFRNRIRSPLDVTTPPRASVPDPVQARADELAAQGLREDEIIARLRSEGLIR